MDIIDISPDHNEVLRALNNHFAKETSWLEAEDWTRLVDMAYSARMAVSDSGEAMGFLIALDETTAYDSVNYQWFKARKTGFLYIDRVLVSPDHQRKGVAQALYADLTERARAGSFAAIVCEVNQDPPNPASDAFHARLGFEEVGRERLASGKTVSYLKRMASPAAP